MQARNARRRIVAAETIVPAVLLLRGGPCLLLGVRQRPAGPERSTLHQGLFR